MESCIYSKGYVMMFHRSTVPLQQELIDICNSTFDTHVGMEGMTGHGLQTEFRNTECR